MLDDFIKFIKNNYKEILIICLMIISVQIIFLAFGLYIENANLTNTKEKLINESANLKQTVVSQQIEIKELNIEVNTLKSVIK